MLMNVSKKEADAMAKAEGELIVASRKNFKGHPGQKPPLYHVKKKSDTENVVQAEATSELARPAEACDSYPDCSPESAECQACHADFPECFDTCSQATARKAGQKGARTTSSAGKRTGVTARVRAGQVIVEGYGTYKGSLRNRYVEMVQQGMSNEQVAQVLMPTFREKYPNRKGLSEAEFIKWVQNRVAGQCNWLRLRQKEAAPADEQQKVVNG